MYLDGLGPNDTVLIGLIMYLGLYIQRTASKAGFVMS
jgi:hypothetical protein